MWPSGLRTMWCPDCMHERKLLAARRAVLTEVLLRLQAAGIVADFGFGPHPDAGWIRWSDSYLRLLEAGRHPDEEPGMAAAWATGDPTAVRRWIEREAAALDGPRRGRPRR